MAMKKEHFVCVEWEDSTYNTGYYDKEHPEKFDPLPSQTIGYLIKKNRRAVVIAGERFFQSDDDIDERHIYTIPRKMVKRIRYLEDKG